MKIMYLTVNYESVQKHIYDYIKDRKQDIKVYLYNICHFEITEKPTEDVIIFNPRWKNIKGPFFYLLRMLIISRNCLRFVNNSKIDILHGNMAFRDGIICRYIFKKKCIPYVVSIRDTDFEIIRKWNLPWIRSVCYAVLKDASKVIYLSSPYKKKIEDMLPGSIKSSISDKSVVLPNGIDDFYLKNIWEPKKLDHSVIRIIAVGKVCYRKNPETTIEAIKLLKSIGIDCNLVLIGKIIDDKYRTIMDECSFVQYVNESPKEIVLDYMRKSDIFVVPSRTETFGLVYAEAMTQGLPVIYTKGQGFDGQFSEGHVGFSVDCENPREIADRIIDIKENYTNISQNCILESKRYDWNTIIDKFLQLYENAMESETNNNRI